MVRRACVFDLCKMIVSSKLSGVSIITWLLTVFSTNFDDLLFVGDSGVSASKMDDNANEFSLALTDTLLAAISMNILEEKICVCDDGGKFAGGNGQ